MDIAERVRGRLRAEITQKSKGSAIRLSGASFLREPARIDLRAFALRSLALRDDGRYRQPHAAIAGNVESHEASRLALEQRAFDAAHHAGVAEDSRATHQLIGGVGDSGSSAPDD